MLIELNSEQADEIKKEHEIYKKLKEGKLSSKEYSQQYDNYPEMIVNEQQIIGWFDSGPNDKNEPSDFMKSYFAWRKRI